MALRALLDVPAPAKLNLFLHVVGRRPDGYHRLQSLFVLIDWCDTLHFETRADGRLTRRDLGEPLPADDLCLRAARLLQAESGCPLGADIAIEKRIPSGAGMGGGSSDAATTLVALNRLWGLGWSRGRLLELGLRIGADVPFFVFGQDAFVEGIGERLRPAPTAPDLYAVVKPPASLETRAVFGHPLLGRHDESDIIESFTEFGRNEPGRRAVDRIAVLRAGNDLEAAAKAVCPAVGDTVGFLERAFGFGRITGSGSAAFAMPDADGPLPALPEGWRGRMCRGLVSHPLAGWVADGDGEVGDRG